MAEMCVGEIGYMIESNRFIREVKVMRNMGGIYLVKFLDTRGGIQVKSHRLYHYEREAQAALDEIKKRRCAFL